METRFREIRIEHGWTIREVVERLENEVHYQSSIFHYSNVELGDSGFSVQFLIAVSYLFNVSTDYLLKLTDTKKRITKSEDTSKKVDNRFRELRIEKGLTMNEVLEQSHLTITASHLGAIERKETAMSVDVLIKFADFYDVSTDYILNLSDERNII
ncbi:MAG: transcriptional regulator [Alkalibacterium sp.]|uniref:Helix-turn-helix domain-containing protein n=1 Tax=Alkalibacterium gilvum TaxID=1130080 RepID=A0A1H6UZE0_9LACT|nr:helix-turn-helix transcriptional regulator [Alkalibacterium gilvum]MDN6194641.1 transcriptional regulator [Alkalibacterium sp.]MDN6736050.1 transcriptional regulator [Tetragenococcus koreensis]SEI97611.1 Helix-turn-helix domain-containing protein [Alkalibacterium gilvum]